MTCALSSDIGIWEPKSRWPMIWLGYKIGSAHVVIGGGGLKGQEMEWVVNLKPGEVQGLRSEVEKALLRDRVWQYEFEKLNTLGLRQPGTVSRGPDSGEESGAVADAVSDAISSDLDLGFGLLIIRKQSRHRRHDGAEHDIQGTPIAPASDGHAVLDASRTYSVRGSPELTPYIYVWNSKIFGMSAAS